MSIKSRLKPIPPSAGKIQMTDRITLSTIKMTNVTNTTAAKAMSMLISINIWMLAITRAKAMTINIPDIR